MGLNVISNSVFIAVMFFFMIGLIMVYAIMDPFYAAFETEMMSMNIIKANKTK